MFATSLNKKGSIGRLALALLLAGLGACHDDGDACDAGTTHDSGSSLVEQGKKLVSTYGCAGCHAPTGSTVLSGQTTPRPGTMAYGANLTPDKDTGIGDWSDDDIAKAIKTGIDDEGETLCPTMPRFSTLSSADVQAITAYLRSLPPVHNEVPESTCPPIKPAPTDGGVDGP